MGGNKDESRPNQKSSSEQGILSYKSNGSQTVLRLFGIELTAPAGLKNPGTIYISFILVNIIIFFVLRGFITG
tara:strand:- start:280 stop:498 length:219 start_codon:yes stop_codon:yes gene_type:complete